MKHRDVKIADNWHGMTNEQLMKCSITDEEEFVDWYGPAELLDPMDEGTRRELAAEGYFTSPEYGRFDAEFEFSYDLMTKYELICNERYAVGYIRLNTKPAKEIVTDRQRYQKAIDRVFEQGENAFQEYALRRFSQENRYVKFHSFVEIQTFDPEGKDLFFWLKLAISLCEKKGAPLLYCELGSIFKHSEFFRIIKLAKRRGLEVIAVKDRGAVEAAQRHIRKPKIFTKKGEGKLNADKAKFANIQRYPILAWKQSHCIPTKRFNTYEFLFNGTDAIYRYFLTERTRYDENPAAWKPINDYDRNIANALHDEGHLTVEGYGWNKQLARKARIMIASKEFREYCVEKFRIMAEWELDDANYRGDLHLS